MPRLLQQPPTRQRYGRTVTDDQVIEQPDVHQLECGFETPRDALVRVTRLGNAAGVVVGNDHRGGVDRERLLDDLARINRRAVNRAAEELIEAQHPVPVVQVEAAEHFVTEM